MNFDTFIADKNLRNMWIRERGISVYVRKSVRFLDGKTVTPCLDVASVEVDEKQRRKGIFKAFLHRVENEAKKLNRAVYVESILNPKLVKFLTSVGYKMVPRTCELSPSMFKIPT